MVAIVTKIKYDIDDLTVQLPGQLLVVIPHTITDLDDIEVFVSDKISDITGFCHFGFEMTIQE